MKNKSNITNKKWCYCSMNHQFSVCKSSHIYLFLFLLCTSAVLPILWDSRIRTQKIWEIGCDQLKSSVSASSTAGWTNFRTWSTIPMSAWYCTTTLRARISSGAIIMITQLFYFKDPGYHFFLCYAVFCGQISLSGACTGLLVQCSVSCYSLRWKEKIQIFTSIYILKMHKF